MGLFEFFFPQWAVAEHLRGIRYGNSRRRRTKRHRQRIADRHKTLKARSEDAEKRIEALEEDLGFLSLLVLSILEALEEKGTITSGGVLGIMQDMDVLDGIVDGKVNVQVLRDLHKTPDS